MPLQTLEGIYREGKIQLIEPPQNIREEARVLITFLPAAATPPQFAPSTDPENPSREELRRRAFERMRKAMNLGGAPYPKREEIDDRFDR